MAEKARASCPVCASNGRAVGPITLQSLLSDDARVRVAALEGYRFCATRGCEVAYYRPGESHRFHVVDMRVPIGQKLADPARPVCYCFDPTAAEVEAGVAATDTSAIPDDIAGKWRQEPDRCPLKQFDAQLGHVRHQALRLLGAFFDDLGQRLPQCDMARTRRGTRRFGIGQVLKCVTG